MHQFHIEAWLLLCTMALEVIPSTGVEHVPQESSDIPQVSTDHLMSVVAFLMLVVTLQLSSSC